jgi:integrase
MPLMSANPLSFGAFLCCNRIGHSVSAEVSMREQPYDGLSLFGPSGDRKYLSAAERSRFVQASLHAPPPVRVFCLTLRWCGGRISEVLALTPAAIDIDSGVASIRTLKRRKRRVIRQVPLPSDGLGELDRTFCGKRGAIRNSRTSEFGVLAVRRPGGA